MIGKGRFHINRYPAQAVNYIHERPEVDQHVMVGVNTEIIFNGQRQGLEIAE